MTFDIGLALFLGLARFYSLLIYPQSNITNVFYITLQNGKGREDAKFHSILKDFPVHI